MTFGESVFTETADLLETAFGEIHFVAVVDHSIDEFVVKRLDPAGAFPGGHGAAKLVGLGAGKFRRHHRHAHRLLLKQRHPECFFQHFAEFVLWIFDILLSLAPFQIWMDHLSLNRPRTNDRDFDDEVIKLPGRRRGNIDICARLST